ncbi:MAG: family 10 glycosylhydrolase [Ignavibacteriales bacterium]|nr:family 10 glycosylhydrolase [Ignavibacteriales bacterium]
MKKIVFILALLVGIVNSILYPQLPNPKYEMRGIWIASLGIDWPSSTGTSSSTITSQKAGLVSILDKHKAYGMNTMFFHVRPVCDAVYKSSYEPWSQYLTGTQGAAPSDPAYDPLTYAVTEAHKRGIELHAWLNPYRALLSGGNTSSLSATHIIKTKPSWIIKCNGSEYRFLNPGLPEVRAYVVKIVMDIVRRYDLDGIHFDDYFYPYSSYGTFNDDAAFNAYSYGFTDRAEWRKNNVNLLLKAIKDSISAVKPFIKFGISPSGNTSVNAGIYCSPTDWLLGRYVDTLGVQRSGASYIDYIMPQLYWVDFYGRLPLWSDPVFLNNRFMYIGHAAYRFEEAGFPPEECSKQITLSRATSTSRGGVYFSSKSVTNNLAHCADTMMRNFYSNPAINHRMNWKTNDEIAPNPPTNLRSEWNATLGKYELKWDAPAAASDGDTAFFYIVYRYKSLPGIPAYGSNIAAVTGEKYLRYAYGRFSTTQGNNYAVSCVDRYSNESKSTAVLQLDTTGNMPLTPAAKFPSQYASISGTTTAIKWSKSSKAESYVLQVSLNPAFESDGVVYLYELKDTTVQFAVIENGKRYFWRVKSANMFGHSAFSDVAVFQSSMPGAPYLASPADSSTNVFRDTKLCWKAHYSASSYQLQLATLNTFAAGSVIADQQLTDTTFLPASPLLANTAYFWRVKTKNAQGESDWSAVWTFTTGLINGTEEMKLSAIQYALEQNFPNPFNASTRIRFSIPVNEIVKIDIYDVLGNYITTLAHKQMNAGTHELDWTGNDAFGLSVPSGMYFVKIQSGSFVQVRKMILLK